MTAISPLAYYDVLAISEKLKRAFESLAVSEVHLFAYLACLLALYRGNAVSNWGYDFVATENGSPYSPEIETAIGVLIREGLLDESDRYLSINHAGRKEFSDLKELFLNRSREDFLNGSCSSVLAMPIGVIRSALTTDRDMKLASQLRDTRRLLSETAVEDLHDAFATLSAEIGIDVRDLMVPAVVWLKYLAQAADVSHL